MTPEAAVKKMRELQNKMEQRSEESAIAAQRYTGHMALYQSACQAGDRTTMEAERDALHASLDVILDNGAMVGELHREMQNIKQNYENL